jgi:putative FmdB family regulatory protein
MPTYEYECKTCSHGFEAFQAMSDPAIKDCPECGEEVRRLIFGGAGVIFKGSGFYVTDKGKSGKTEAKSDSPQKSEACSSCSHAEKCETASKQSSAGTETVKSPEKKAELKSKSA